MKESTRERLISLQIKAERIDRLQDMLVCLEEDAVHVVFGRELDAEEDVLRFERAAERVTLPVTADAPGALPAEDDEGTLEAETLLELRELLVTRISGLIERLEGEIETLLGGGTLNAEPRGAKRKGGKA